MIFLLGAFFSLAVRFIFIDYTPTHYHANFAVYVNGKQEDFRSFAYYEEKQSCSGEKDNPRSRAHMHDQINSIVHVHDQAATWGNFFENLGFSVDAQSIKTADGLFVTDGNKKMHYILNGREIENIANEVIHSEDKLLVAYGEETNETLATKSDLIKNEAAKFNTTADPSSCSGSETETPLDRLKRVVLE